VLALPAATLEGVAQLIPAGRHGAAR